MSLSTFTRGGSHRRIAASVLATLAVSTVALTGASSIQAVADAPGGVADGLVLWLDASNPNGDGTSPAEGAEVTTWADRSGTGNEATVNPNGWGTANTGAYFESAPDGFNGRPALRFDREDDNSGSVYQTADLDIRASVRPDVTIIALYLPTSLSINNGVWGADDGDWDRFFLSYIPYFGDGVDDGLVSLGPDLSGEPISDAGTTDAPNLMTVGYSGNVVEGDNQGDEDASFVYFNCALERTFTDSTHATDGLTTLSVGWDGDTSVFDGYIAEVIAYDRVLTSTEVEAVNGYLATKYQLESGCSEFVIPEEPIDTGGQLPPTGSSSSGLWLTAALLAVGGVLVAGGRRRSVR